MRYSKKPPLSGGFFVVWRMCSVWSEVTKWGLQRTEMPRECPEFGTRVTALERLRSDRLCPVPERGALLRRPGHAAFTGDPVRGCLRADPRQGRPLPNAARQRLILPLGFAALVAGGLTGPLPARPAGLARPVLDCRDFPRFGDFTNRPHAVEIDPDTLHADGRTPPFVLTGQAGLLIAAAGIRRRLTLTPEPGAKIAIRTVSRGRTVTARAFVIAPCPAMLGDRLGIMTLLSTRPHCVLVEVRAYFVRKERIAVGPDPTPGAPALNCESP